MKRRVRNQRRNATNKLDFQRLEPRELLAGDMIAPHQAAGLLPQGANIVVNGDFERLEPGEDRFYTESEVAGWNAMDSSTGQELNIIPWNVDGYNNVLDLDSTSTDYDRVFQNVATESETEYLLAFDYRNHPTVDPNATAFTHDFEVLWNGSLVGRFTGGDHWNTSVIRVTSSNLESTQLMFSEIQESGAPGGDGRGALLDNIRVVKSDPITISNGGFESTVIGDGVFFQPEDVEGWSVIAANPGQRLLQLVEGVASEGLQYMNLDTTGEHRDIVSRELATEAGASYYVTFDMRVDGDQTENPDELRVRWNQQWASTIFGTTEWETYGLLLTADSDLTELMFLEPGETNGNGSGPLIDNIQMFMVTSPVVELVVDANGDGEGVDESTVYVPGAGAQSITPDLVISNPAGSELTSVVVTLDGVVDGDDEVISVSEGSIPTDGAGAAKIVVTPYDTSTNQLVMTGSATVAEYEAILQTLAYFNAANVVSTTNRSVNIKDTDSGLPAESSTAEATVDLTIETSQVLIDSAIITKFIADNSLDAQHLGNGLYAVIDDPGTGLNPTINSTVRVKYNGKFIELNDENKLVEGASFDFSSDSGISFPLTNVIVGWQLGIPAFKTGGIGQLIIPSDLAYGPSGTGSGSIPPNSILVFDIELLEIVS